MLFLLEAQLLLRIILNIDFDRPSVNGIYNHWMAAIWPWISTLGRMNADSDLRKVRTNPMCALRRLTGLDARRGSQQMALVLCKKHNTAGRPVSHALRGFHSNRLSALSDFDRPRHAFSQMP
ncbi:hypothetical protein AYI88_16990 [Shewanella algae]|nr:hypothetical protein AYI88_16990 [Shewanella algae]